jgi:hypothetical protein
VDAQRRLAVTAATKEEEFSKIALQTRQELKSEADTVHVIVQLDLNMLLLLLYVRTFASSLHRAVSGKSSATRMRSRSSFSRPRSYRRKIFELAR